MRRPSVSSATAAAGNSFAPASRGRAACSEGVRRPGSEPPRISCCDCTMNSISRMPPGPSFTLSLQLAPLDLAGDHRLHLAQALVDAVVEVAPVHEGAHDVVVERAVARRAGDGARLHPGVALPVAAVLLQVILERAEVHGERSRLAERPQAHVHAEHESLGGAGIEQPDQGLAEAREVLLVRDLARAVGLALFRVEEDEVDVRGEVELAAAELAHADDDEFLRLAGSRPRRAVARRERAHREVERGADRAVRERRKLAQRLVERGETGEIAPGDAHELVPPQAPQCVHERGLVAVPGGKGRRERPPISPAARARSSAPDAASPAIMPGSRVADSNTKLLAAKTAGSRSRMAAGNASGSPPASRQR